MIPMTSNMPARDVLVPPKAVAKLTIEQERYLDWWELGWDTSRIAYRHGVDEARVYRLLSAAREALRS